MRFSVLTLNMKTVPRDRSDALDEIVRFAAEENITSLCLQGCEQRDESPILEDRGPVRSDNTAAAIQAGLEHHGLKYSMGWDVSNRAGSSGIESGPAVLAQLPILSSCSRFVSASDDASDPGSRLAVMARLAIAPNAVIDVYSIQLSDPEHGMNDELQALFTFIEETPDVLERMKPPPPKRRGAPRKRPPVVEPVVSTRLICLAGGFGAEPDRLGDVLRGRNFLEASAAIRDSEGSLGTTRSGFWSDYIFIKPALRPQNPRLAFTGTDRPRMNEHHAVVVEFEV
jgi:hypothetical protein